MRTDLTIGEFVSLDPAIRSAGVALWRGGQLVNACAVKLTSPKGADMGARCLAMAESCARWVVRNDAAPRALVFEWPQIYSVSKSEGDPNNLVPLAGVAMALAGILGMGAASRNLTLEVITYLPREWTRAAGTKSTKAKEFETSMRTGRIRRRLSAEELAALAGVASHDAYDAVGLGLHSLGRLEPIRVFAGAED